jgi:hypothetical protein
MQFDKMMKLLVDNRGSALKTELESLCQERWLMVVQTDPEQRAEEVVGGLVALLEDCGYNPSYAWFNGDELHHRLAPIQRSPFTVLLLPTDTALQQAEGLTIHTLVRDAQAPNHLNGAVLHPLAKVVAWTEDNWAVEQFSKKENISQFVSLTHNGQSSIVTAQQLITAAALHIGVLESVSERHFSQHNESMTSSVKEHNEQQNLSVQSKR